MKILLPVSLAVCAAFTGCLPPPLPGVVVAPGYHRHPYGYGYPYGYHHESEYHPYRRHGEVVVVSRHAPAPRYEVAGRPPYPGARWIPGKWIYRPNGWVWQGGHWVRHY